VLLFVFFSLDVSPFLQMLLSAFCAGIFSRHLSDFSCFFVHFQEVSSADVKGYEQILVCIYARRWQKFQR
jgi:hypothetical protein